MATTARLLILTNFSILRVVWTITSLTIRKSIRERKIAMAKRAIALVVASGLLAVAGGCNVWHALIYEPFGPNSLCDSRRCGMRCGEVAGCDAECVPGPVRGRYVRGPMAGPCGDECYDDCAGPPCNRCCGFGDGPLACIFSLFHPESYRGCGTGCGGCGERYWGDWYGDPPECCDPCDQHGNFTAGGWGGGGQYARRAASPMPMSDSYEEGVPAPRPGGCRNCGQGGYASHGYAGMRPPTQVASSSRPAPNRRATTPYTPGDSRPRMLSSSDRVVKPAAGEQTPHLAQPLRADNARLE
jgi:hypothetical protein